MGRPARSDRFSCRGRVECRRQQRRREQLGRVGLGRRRRQLRSGAQVDHVVGGFRERGCCVVGQRDGRRALPPRLFDDRHDVRRAARLRDADDQRVGHVRMRAVERDRRGRRQRDDQAVADRQQVLRVDAGVVRRSPRGDDGESGRRDPSAAAIGANVVGAASRSRCAAAGCSRISSLSPMPRARDREGTDRRCRRAAGRRTASRPAARRPAPPSTAAGCRSCRCGSGRTGRRGRSHGVRRATVTVGLPVARTAAASVACARLEVRRERADDDEVEGREPVAETCDVGLAWRRRQEDLLDAREPAAERRCQRRRHRRRRVGRRQVGRHRLDDRDPRVGGRLQRQQPRRRRGRG